MALLDAFDFLSLVEFFSWRVITSTVIGIVCALVVYYAFDRTEPASTAAVALGFAGFCIGLFWELFQRRLR